MYVVDLKERKQKNIHLHYLRLFSIAKKQARRSAGRPQSTRATTKKEEREKMLKQLQTLEWQVSRFHVALAANSHTCNWYTASASQFTRREEPSGHDRQTSVPIGFWQLPAVLVCQWNRQTWVTFTCTCCFLFEAVGLEGVEKSPDACFYSLIFDTVGGGFPLENKKEGSVSVSRGDWPAQPHWLVNDWLI